MCNRLFFSIFGIKKSSNYLLDNEVNNIREELNKLKSLIVSNNNHDTPIEEASNCHKDISADVNAFLSEEKILEEFDVPPPFPADEYHLNPLSVEIENDIRLAKPFDREHRKSSYIGLIVQWKGLLYSVSKVDDISKYCITITFSGIRCVWYSFALIKIITKKLANLMRILRFGYVVKLSQ